MARYFEVTRTAVRMRLSRVLDQDLVARESVPIARGRPKYVYRLTQKGLRLTGSNFADLAIVLWKGILAIEEEEVRRTVLRRVVESLADAYAGHIDGENTEERMQALADLLAQRRVSFSVDQPYHDLPVLTAHTCPYPDLAEKDQTICVLERLLFAKLLGTDLTLAQNRTNGGGCCQFRAG
jgi:predicted ArsR family transcriptional regulator